MMESLSSGLILMSRTLSAWTIDPVFSSGKYVMFLGVEHEPSIRPAASSIVAMDFMRIVNSGVFWDVEVILCTYRVSFARGVPRSGSI